MFRFGRDTILVVDNDEAVINEFKKQAQNIKDHVFLILRWPFSPDDRDSFTENAGHIKAAFIDFQLDETSHEGAIEFMAWAEPYINWHKLNLVYWFSGDEHVGQYALQEARRRFPKISKTGFLRKPFLLSDIVALVDPGFSLDEQWHCFPWPLRVINRDGEVVVYNQRWQGPINLPDPKAFITEQGSFEMETRDYFDRLPCEPLDKQCDGEVEPVVNTPPVTGLFNLVSFLSSDQNYLFQFAERLKDQEELKTWQGLVKSITTSLEEINYTRVRFYRHLAVPHSYGDDVHHPKNLGIMALCYTSTQLENKIHPEGIQKGVQECPIDKEIGNEMQIRLEKIIGKINAAGKLDSMEFSILENGEDSFLAKPDDAINYNVVELPLFTESERIFSLTNSRLMGVLAFDKYSESTKFFGENSEKEMKRLEPKLLQFCKAVVTALEVKITPKSCKP